MENKAGVEAVMSSTRKSSSLSPMKIGECACCCVYGGGMSPTEAVGVRTGAWTVDIVKFLGVNCCMDVLLENVDRINKKPSIFCYHGHYDDHFNK